MSSTMEDNQRVRLEIEPFVFDRPQTWENFKAEMILLWMEKGLLKYAETDVLGSGAPDDRTKRSLAGVETRQAARVRREQQEEEEANDDAAQKEAKEEARMKDARTLLLLRKHICAVSKSHIAGAKSAFQAWEILTMEVEQRITAEVVDYEREMSCTKLKDFASMTLYLKEMEDIRKRLLLGSQHIDPKNFVLRVLNGIGEEYEAQKAHIRLMNDMGQAIPYSAVRPMLIAAAKDKGGRDGTKAATATVGQRRGKRNDAHGIGEDEEVTALANKVLNIIDKRDRKQRRGAASMTNAGAQGVCFLFRDTGSCKWGDACRFWHGDRAPQLQRPWGKGGPFRSPGPAVSTRFPRGRATNNTAFTMAIEEGVQRALSQVVRRNTTVPMTGEGGWALDGDVTDEKRGNVLSS